MAIQIPDTAPTTMEEWEELCRLATLASKEQYDEEVAKTKAAAEESWNKEAEAKREAAMEEATANIKAQEFESEEALEQALEEAKAQIKLLDKELLKQKEQYIQDAISFIEQPNDLAYYQNYYSIYKPQEDITPPEEMVTQHIDFYDATLSLGGTFYKVSEGRFITAEEVDQSTVTELAGEPTIENIRENIAHYRRTDPRIQMGPELMYTEELRQYKLDTLKASLTTARKHAKVVTAGGWEADANETAYTNIQGLIATMENDTDTVQFRDAANEFQTVTRSELEEIQKQVATKNQALYQAKWTIHEKITTAETKEELLTISTDIE